MDRYDNPILSHRKEVRNRILKGFVDNDIEKAHKDGDIHPNGKWYWNADANGGKGDWRVIGGRIQKQSEESKRINTNKQTSHPDPEDVDVYIMKESGMSKDEVAEIKEIVKKWTNKSFKTIRSYQRGKIKDDEAKDMADKLEHFIDVMPKWNGGTTYRGISFQRKIYEAYNIGDEISPGALSSWSTSIKEAKKHSDFGSETIIRCNFPQYGTSVKYLSHPKYETGDEVMTSSKCRYKIIGKTKVKRDKEDGDMLILDVQPINN